MKFPDKYDKIYCMDTVRILPGKPLDQGAVYTDGGVNFCLFSRHASAVFLELFNNPDDSMP